MVFLRKSLMYLSAAVAVVLAALWLIMSRGLDIGVFFLIFAFGLNAFYIYFSEPTVKTSEVIGGASTKLALASLELRQLSQEVQLREVEAEKRRLAEAEHEQYKLNVARDLLQHLQSKLTVSRAKEPKVPHLTFDARPEKDARGALINPSVTTGAGQPPADHAAGTSVVQPVLSLGPTPSPAPSKEAAPGAMTVSRYDPGSASVSS